MKSIFKFNQEYDGTVDFTVSEGKFESMWLDITDCDETRTITVRVPFNKVEELQIALSGWINSKK